MQKHYSITVTGTVQGVWYRASTQRQAEELGLKGFVRNQPDGSVYLEAEGDENALETLVTWCWEGPPRAEVDQVTVREEKWRGFSHFEIQG